MHTFTDSRGRPWQLDVNCDTIEETKLACGVNLLDLADPESSLLQEVNAFPPLLAKLLYAALAEQARLKEVDEREFRRSMSGDVLAAATEALLEEIVLFCPQHRRRLLQAVLLKNREVEEAGIDLALTRLQDPALTEQALAAMDAQLRQQIAAALKNLAPPADNSPSAIGSSINAGSPPDCCDSPTDPASTPGDASAASLPALGVPTPG